LKREKISGLALSPVSPSSHTRDFFCFIFSLSGFSPSKPCGEPPDTALGHVGSRRAVGAEEGGFEGNVKLVHAEAAVEDRNVGHDVVRRLQKVPKRQNEGARNLALIERRTKARIKQADNRRHVQAILRAARRQQPQHAHLRTARERKKKRKKSMPWTDRKKRRFLDD
jgi:hypothetical protein